MTPLPETKPPEFHVKPQFWLRTHPWVITNDLGQAGVRYDYKEDAWAFANKLARQTRGIAILHDVDGTTKQKRYGISSSRGAAAPARVNRRGAQQGRRRG